MEVYDCIQLNINGKVRKIELCLGDITKLSVDNSVDLLLLSAFPNNYVPVKGTVIGSLQTNLNLSIKSLAKDKEEDLRQKFHCWISKKLPNHLPYRRILCFEQCLQNRPHFDIFEDQSNLVGDVFRALFTTFQNKEFSVITPILSSGNQGSDKTKMLNEMVRSCSAWITAGMPLSCMKIVIYHKNENIALYGDDKRAIEEFSRIKSEINWLPNINKAIIIKHEALFFYVSEDEDETNLFIDILKDIINENVSFVMQCIEKNNDYLKKYQEIILESKKVGLFLTPNFLENKKAVEIYNIVLCLTQRTERSLLIPLLLKRIDDLPHYMTLNQWIDCRMKDAMLNKDEGLRKGVEVFLKILKTSKNVLKKDNYQTNEKTLYDSLNNENSFTESNYDIFISYCHKDSSKAKMILKHLKLALPDVSIFYDKNDIKSGSSWQETIYNALNSSKLVLALLSENYFQSSMCHEEFNIAVSQHWSSQFNTTLFPLWISDQTPQEIIVKENLSFHKVFLTNNIFVPSFAEKFDTESLNNVQIIAICNFLLQNVIKNVLLGKNINHYFNKMPFINLEDAATIARKQFLENWNLTNNFDMSPKIIETSPEIESLIRYPYDIAIGFHKDDYHYANYLKASILEVNKELKVIFVPTGNQDDEIKNVTKLESAHLHVLLLKPYYVMTKSCQHQLHTSLSLQRRNLQIPHFVLPIILENLPQKPSYLHLLSSRFKVHDEMYQSTKLLKSKALVLQNIVIKNCVDIPLRVKIMFNFTSYWIGENIFVKSSSKVVQAPIIYSTLDLINTNFNSPQCANLKELNEKIKNLDVTKLNIKEAKDFLMLEKNETKLTSLPRGMMSTTKVCTTM